MTPEFGATAWGRAWLRLAEPTAVGTIDTRLPKARALARRGQVDGLATGPGRVSAVVRVRDAEHPVRLGFAPWPAATRDRITAFLRDDASARRALSAGDAPDALAAAVADVAPGPDDLDPGCPCRERRRPCLHQLAVLYALVQRIDEAPALALELRGWQPPAGPAGDGDERPAGRIPLTAVDPASFYAWRAAPADG
nr:putative SWIM Zn-finger [uncultured bacterium]